MPETTANPVAYTPRQFAARLGVHENTVRKWVRQGTVKAMKLGFVVRVPHSELTRLLTTPASTPAQ